MHRFHPVVSFASILEGTALCLVQGNRYHVGGYETAFVPVGKPHWFINQTDSIRRLLLGRAGLARARRVPQGMTMTATQDSQIPRPIRIADSTGEYLPSSRWIWKGSAAISGGCAIKRGFRPWCGCAA